MREAKARMTTVVDIDKVDIHKVDIHPSCKLYHKEGRRRKTSRLGDHVTRRAVTTDGSRTIRTMHGSTKPSWKGAVRVVERAILPPRRRERRGFRFTRSPPHSVGSAQPFRGKEKGPLSAPRRTEGGTGRGRRRGEWGGWAGFGVGEDAVRAYSI